MKQRSREVDAYIAASEPFARPILKELRDALHEACPEVRETMKWSVPHFEHHGVLASMSAHKRHVNFGFWKGALMRDPAGLFAADRSMAGSMKLESVSDVPERAVLVEYIREAAALNEQGVKVPSKPRSKKAVELEVPEDLRSALKENPKARAQFEAFSPSHRNEYSSWIGEAKREETRRKRVATAIEWLSAGKARNWKYER